MMAANALLCRASRGLLIGLIVCCSALASAQEKPSRERETLRRTQLALRAAQEGQTALMTERDKLSESLAQSQRQHAADTSAIEATQQQIRAVREAASHSASSLTTAQAELAVVKRSADEDRSKLETELQTLRSQTIVQQRRIAERTTANVGVTRLLEQSVEALAKAEATNRQLYDIGNQLLKAYREKGVLDAAMQRDPIFGYGDVQLENRAQDFRDRMARSRLAPTRPSPD